MLDDYDVALDNDVVDVTSLDIGVEQIRAAGVLSKLLLLPG